MVYETETTLFFKFTIFIVIILIIIAIIYQITNMQDTFTTFKCLQNGYKLAFSDKINSNIIQQKHPFISYDNITDGRLTPLTLDNKTKNQLNYILKQILNDINKQTHKKYFLRNIDSVNITSNKQGSVTNANVERDIFKRCTVDFFAHELIKQETRRFIIVFTIDIKRNIKIEHINLSNAYNIDYGNIECTDKLNNNNLIHTDEALLTNNINNICGITKIKNDYSNLTESEKITNKNIGFINANNIGKSLFLPSIVHDTCVLNAQGFFPNRKHSNWWDKNGVTYVENANINTNNTNNTNIKMGLDHGIGKREYQPNQYLSNYKLDVYKNKNHDLFNMSRGNFINRNLSI